MQEDGNEQAVRDGERGAKERQADRGAGPGRDQSQEAKETRGNSVFMTGINILVQNPFILSKDLSLVQNQ